MGNMDNGKAYRDAPVRGQSGEEDLRGPVESEAEIASSSDATAQWKSTEIPRREAVEVDFFIAGLLMSVSDIENVKIENVPKDFKELNENFLLMTAIQKLRESGEIGADGSVANWGKFGTAGADGSSSSLVLMQDGFKVSYSEGEGQEELLREVDDEWSKEAGVSCGYITKTFRAESVKRVIDALQKFYEYLEEDRRNSPNGQVEK